jgi:hypothetical protein
MNISDDRKERTESLGTRVSPANLRQKLVAYSGYTLILRLDALPSSETAMNPYQTTWRHIVDDSSL